MRKGKDLLQIGAIAQRAGTTIRTVRYYLEKEFITASERSQGGFYLFEPGVIDTVSFIQGLKNLGMPLKEIEALIKIRRKNKTGNEAYPLVMERLEKQKDLLEKKISEYNKLRGEIVDAIDLVCRCKGCKKKPDRENCLACDVVRQRDTLPVPFAAIL